MRPLAKSSLLWGALGALSFLAGVQALQLLTAATVSLAVALGVAALVGVVAAGVSHWLERRLGPAFAARTEEGGAVTGEKEQP